MASYQYIYVMKDLTKVYPGGRETLKGLSLSFFPGAKIGVLGPNGAGKSTLLKIMAGIDKEYSGEAWAAAGVSVGYLAQEPQLDPAKDVLGNVMEGVAPTKALLDRFEEVGLVDDAAYAREWVAQRQTGRGLARRALAVELRRKGIDDDTAREALAEVDPDDEVDAARELVRRRLRSVRGLPGDKAVNRLVGMLARKGHSPGTAFRVVREELGADLADPEHTGP